MSPFIRAVTKVNRPNLGHMESSQHIRDESKRQPLWNRDKRSIDNRALGFGLGSEKIMLDDSRLECMKFEPVNLNWRRIQHFGCVIDLFL